MRDLSASFKLRVAFIFIINIVNLVGGLFPILIKQCRKNHNMMSVLNAFASGLFLSMALVHIQPEAVSTYLDIKKEGCPGVGAPGARLLYRELDNSTITDSYVDPKCDK